ncbi:MAG TPA: DUF6036 family nucleotidyltransferase [Thermoanaerobaculia bacterium]|nr:DUF6036 family nucleotidyltransferase [Thermoanaerobaculia bacterium]
MNVSKDFEELLAFFDARKVRALVVGGYAFAFHAKPRYTKDLDILIDPSPENVEKVLQALADFGFEALNLTVEDLTTPGNIVQLGHPPGRVDLLTSLKGVHFEDAWQHRVQGRYGSQIVSYIGLEDLIRNKEAVGRPQDRADLSVLRRPTKTKRKPD